jgi:signal transduction histidine kinase
MLDSDWMMAASLRWLMHENRLSAHDVRAPLNAVQLSLELLVSGLADESALDQTTPPKWQRHVGVIRDELARLNRLLDTALDQKELVSGKPDAFDLRDVIAQVIRVLGYEARTRRVRLVLELPDEPLPITAPRGKVKVAFFEALHSAMRSCPEGVELHIEVAKRDTVAQVLVTAAQAAPAPWDPMLLRVFQSLGGEVTRDGMALRMSLPSGASITPAVRPTAC